MSVSINNRVIDSNLHELITAVNSDSTVANYPIEKLDAHLRDIRHEAVSIFVFNGPHLLMQKRADTKYHSGGLWANTVCSHPRWQETASECAGRRLTEELGWNIPVQEFGEIVYQAKVGELYENEHVHCFFGHFDQQNNILDYNRNEVSEVRWLSIDEIMHQISYQPEIFTEWFKIYMMKHRDMIINIM